MKLCKLAVILLMSVIYAIYAHAGVRITKKIPVRDDILLIINYNFPFYDSIKFLKDLYGPYFSHIVFYGPTEHPEVQLCEHHEGWFSYKGIADAMQKYPGFAGYLWIHDDLIINPWNLTRFDTNKVWNLTLEPKDLNLGMNAVQGWHWWQKAVGYPAIKKVYDELEPKYKKILEHNLGEHMIAMGYGDMVYIPARCVQDFTVLCNLCAKYELFLEIAVSAICSCLVPKEEIETFKGVVLWYDGTRINPQDHYSRQLDYIHPMKCSDEQVRGFLKREFAAAAISYYL